MTMLFSRRSREHADIAIDLGTANTRVIGRGAGVLFDQPSLCCFEDDGISSKVVAVGHDASKIMNRTSGTLKVRSPLARGVLQDIDAARELLKFAVRSGTGRRGYGRPNTIIGVPADATQAECAALHTAAADAGLRTVNLVREPLAAAFGADLPVDEPTGSMIVECGAGTTEVAVLSLGGFCLTRSARGGGAALDAGIASYLHKQHQFLIGEPTAERLKRELAVLLASPATDRLSVEIKGRSLKDRRPGVLTLSAGEFLPVFTKHAGQIAGLVRQVLNETPPQISHDICGRGIVLTGGSALPFIAEVIGIETNLVVNIADQNKLCVTRGLSKILSA